MAKLVCSTGCTRFLLEMLSGDRYSSLHLPAVNVLHIVAMDSEYHAACLAKALVIEKMLESQLVHGLKIRTGALKVITCIAMHSKKLCQQVLNKDGCLKSMLVACKRKELTSSAFPLLHQFCMLIPSAMLRNDILDAVRDELHMFSDMFSDATSCVGSLVNVASSEEDIMFVPCLEALIFTIRYADNATNPEYASRGKQALQMLAYLCSKPILGIRFFSHPSAKTQVAQLLWSPTKENQMLACNLVAAWAKSLREHGDQADNVVMWCNTDLIPPLVKLLAYDGTTRAPATKACTELIRSSPSIARTVVLANGIPPLCDALNSSTEGDSKEGNEYKLGILLALRTLYEVKHDGPINIIYHSIGTNLARAMLG